MFELRPRVRQALILVGAIALAGSISRISAAQSTAELRARVVAARRAVKIARDSTDTLRHMHSRDVPPDSMRAGAIEIRFEQRELTAKLETTLKLAAEHAWSVTDSQYGDAASSAVAGSQIWVSRFHHKGLFGNAIEAVEMELGGAGGGGRQLTSLTPITQRKLTDDILDLVGTAATRDAPKNLMTWVGYWTPSRRISNETWTQVALDVATSNASVARSCYTGSIQSCESALGLTTLTDSLTEWYSPDGWRVLVASFAPPTEAAALAERAECVVKNVSKTCERLARTHHILVPLNATSRAALLGLAIERGGRSAYSRLLKASGSPAQILATTAGMPEDSLVGEWRSVALANMPHSVTPVFSEASVLVAWTLIFGFAATRRRP